ncbi:MAG: hypothetical protein ABR499_02280 [Gemmatimonadaceae bacterium]
MTIAEWLATRTPAPPPALMSRVREALGAGADEDRALATDRCLDAAERIVAGLLRDGRVGRESAPDLLTADALVTYAFEAASDDVARLTDRARDAMTRLARLGTVAEARLG